MEPGAPEAATLRRAGVRLLPFLALAYLVCHVDRVHAGFAALQMNGDIGLGGTFFIGYFLHRRAAGARQAGAGRRRGMTARSGHRFHRGVFGDEIRLLRHVGHR